MCFARNGSVEDTYGREIVLPTTTMAVTTINADGLLETSEAEDVNMSDTLNPADEENLLTSEDEHGGSEDEIRHKSPSTVNERPATKEQPPRISRDRKRPSSEKSATKKFRPRGRSAR